MTSSSVNDGPRLTTPLARQNYYEAVTAGLGPVLYLVLDIELTGPIYVVETTRSVYVQGVSSLGTLSSGKSPLLSPKGVQQRALNQP